MSLKELSSIRHIPTRIRRILELATDLQSRDVEQSSTAAREALRLADQLKSRELIAQASRTVGLSFYYAREYKEALTYLDRALEIYTKKRDLNSVARTLQNIGVCHARLGQHESALQAYSRSEEYFRKTNDDKNRSLVLINMAVIYTTINNKLKAFETYSECLQLLESIDDEHGIAAVSGNLGQMFVELGESDKAMQWMERSLDMHRKINNVRGVAFVLRELGSLYERIGKHAMAHEQLAQALAIYEQSHDVAGQAETSLLLAELLLPEKRYADAMKYCTRAQQLFAELHDSLNAARSCQVEGRTLSAQKKYALAGAALERGLEHILRTDNYAQHADYYFLLAENHIVRKLFDRAHKHLQKSLKLSAEHKLHERLAAAHDLLSLLYEREGNLLKALRHTRKAQLSRREFEAQLASRKVQDLKYRVDIARVERDREAMRQQSEQYRVQLDAKSKELNTSALALAQKNEIISSLKQKINSLTRTSSDEGSDALSQVSRMIDDHIRSDKQMEGVTKQLSDFHQDFIHQLSAEFRGLSPTEIKICSLLKLNLNTKEIADFLCVSFKSVEVYRARIRKKLGLSEGENLSAFIMAYGATS